MSVGSRWARLGAVSPSKLETARLDLHRAAQPVGLVGKQLLAPVADHSHGSLEWLDEPGALAGQPLPDGWRAALRVASQELLVLDEAAHVSDSLELRSHTVAAASAWVHDRLLQRSGVAREAEWGPHTSTGLPDASVGRGAPFGPAGAAHVELARWFGNVNGVLRRIANREPEATQVRAWPHHFDLATLIVFDPDSEPEKARSVGLGLSPGDGSMPEPYLYALPWPAPDPASLPPLTSGSWVTDGWVGAAMVGSDLVAAGGGSEQAAAATHFFEASLTSLKELLDVG